MLGLAMVLALGLGACGGTETKTEPEAPTSSSASDTPTPSPSAAPTPQSRFENRPEVKIARAWAEAYAKDINAGDRSLPNLTPLITKAGRKVHLRHLMAEDLGKVTYPGPLPFTPLQIVRRGKVHGVGVCLMADGWGLDKTTNKPAGKREILPFVLLLEPEGGQLKMANAVLNTKDKRCRHTTVKGYPWP